LRAGSEQATASTAVAVGLVLAFFARFDPDRGSATPIKAPAEMAETFVQ
jgi:hypothetical protein